MGRQRKDTFLFVLGSCIIGMIAWMVIDSFLGPIAGKFNARAVATFVAFLFIPLIILALTGKGLELGRPDLGLVLSIIIYQLFAVWLIAYYLVNPGYFKDYVVFGADHLLFLALTAFYVPAVDFFVRRVVHLEIENITNERTGLVIGILAWVLGHGLEIVWLSELMNPIGSVLFIVSSGTVTSLLFMRYKNIVGLMVGHWVLNLVVTSVTSVLS